MLQQTKCEYFKDNMKKIM